MAAVTQQNYLAALKIMEFVEEMRREREREQNQSRGSTCPGSLGERWSKVDISQDVPSSQAEVDISQDVPSSQAEVDISQDVPSSQAEDAMDKQKEESSKKPSRPQDSLLQEAIIAPGDGGITPIQALFASLSRHYDCKTMCLYASCVPSAFTAPQLLRLFQSRYPSAYKVEILKGAGEVTSSESGSETSESEEEEEEEEGADGDTLQPTGDQPMAGSRTLGGGPRSSWRQLIGINISHSSIHTCTCTYTCL